MARIRTIKPEFWSHPILSRAEDEVRLAALGYAVVGGCGGGIHSRLERSEQGARIPADACSDVEPNAHISIKPRVCGFALVDLWALCFEASMTLEELRAERGFILARMKEIDRIGDVSYGRLFIDAFEAVNRQIRDIEEREQRLANIRASV